MKKVLAVSLLFTIAVSASYAEMTRLGSMRVKSMADMGAVASALAIMAEQPLLGMMAIDAMQQGAQQQFGEVDQTKPILCVLYSKAALPDLSTVDLANDPEAVMAFATNLVYAAMIPVSLPTEDYLEARGAIDVVDGVAKLDEAQYVSCKDGYAIWSNDPDGVKQADCDMPCVQTAFLEAGVMEVVLEKVVLAKYAEIMEAMQKVKATDTESSPFGRFASAIAEYQKAQMETVRQLMGEMDRVVMGLNYDLTGGLTMDFMLDVEKTGTLGKMLETASVVDPDAYAQIPENTDFFMVSANVSDMAFEAKKVLETMSTTLVPSIKDEDSRKAAEAMIAEVQWLYDNTGEVVAFLDRDKESRIVMVSRLKSKDNARYLVASKTSIDSMMHILGKYAPDQKFFTYDATSRTSLMDFEAFMVSIIEKFGEEPDAEDIEKMMKAFDAILGRKFEMVCREKDGYNYQLGKAVGSDYEIPVALDSSVIADRIKAIMPAGASAKPMQVFSVSLGSIIKHLAPRMMKIAGEEDDGSIEIFDNLADAGTGGITAVVWNENGKFRETVNISAVELKGFFKFFTAMQQQITSQVETAMGELEEGDGEADDMDATDAEEATPVSCETDATDDATETEKETPASNAIPQ